MSSLSGESGGDGGGGCQADADCEGDPAGGICDTATGMCWPECAPGAEQPCYTGPDGTADVGACISGMQVCTEMGTLDPACAGEVLPTAEDCAAPNGADDDCDGLVDDTDVDGDGFGQCSSDCCDAVGACTEPTLVNPGAYEVEGNMLDDDCDGMVDETTGTCDTGLSSSTNDATTFARAMELCGFTEEEPVDPANRTWGVVSAQLSRADGNGTPFAVQHSIRDGFGDLMTPERGDSLVVLSSGHAADLNDQNPDYAGFQAGVDLGSVASAPVDWVDANGGTFPNPANCPEPWSSDANDSIMLTLRVRAPTNARSFSLMMNFLSAEYPEWVCSQFNDFFVALIDSTSGDNPDDKNIAFYDDDGTQWPVGVNLVMVADGIFAQCENGQVGCAEGVTTNYTGCVGNALLDGTGFDEPDDGCDMNQTQVGGGTGWLQMSGNVTPGEIFELRLAVWDTSGHIFDSLVLLDDFSWSVDAAEPGIVPG